MKTLKSRYLPVIHLIVLSIASIPAYAGFGGTDPSLGTEITSLPETITVQGKYYLSSNHGLNLASGAALTINVNNVVINLNGFKIGNLAAGASNSAVGILASSRKNVTIRRGIIRGFKNGIELSGASGSGHAVSNVRLDGNYSKAIVVNGDGIRVSSNTIVNNGGSTIASLPSIGIDVSSTVGAQIHNNRIFSSIAAASGLGITGISLTDVNGAHVSNNVISNAAVTAETETAVLLQNTTNVVVINSSVHNYDAVVNNTGSGTVICRNNFSTGSAGGYTCTTLSGANL